MHPTQQAMLDGADLLPNGGCSEQSLSFLFGIVFLINGASVYVVDDNSKSY